MSVLGAGEAFMLASGEDAYTIQRSLRFNDGDSAHLTRSFQPGRQKKWTWSSWIKRAELGATGRILRANPSGEAGIQFLSNDRLEVYHYQNGSYVVQVVTDRVFRDLSAWFHLVVVYDSDQATPADRLVIYINGVKETQFNTSTYPSPGYQSYLNSFTSHAIFGSDLFPAGYLADVHFLDGTAISDPDGVFGEFSADTGVWNPIEYTHSAPIDYSNNNQITIDPGNYYLNGLNGPNAFNGNGFTYIDSRLGTGSNNTTNIIWQPTGGIENVTKIRVHTNYATHYRINDGTWTSFNSAGTYAQIYSGTAFTLTKLEIRRDNCQASDWGHRVTFYEINDVEYQNVGINSFHLDFDPDVTGVTYSAGGDNTNASSSGGHWSSLFDSAYDGAAPVQNTTMTWTGNIPATGKNVRIAYRADSNAGGSIVVNNTSTTLNSGNFYTLQWVDLGTFSADITSMSVSRANVSMGGGIIFSYLEVDGKILINYEAPGVDASGGSNHWTPKNFSLSTTSVTHWRQATSSDNPSSGTVGSISYRPFRSLTDPATSSLVWDHQNTQVMGLQNITGITSLRLLVSSRGSAKLGINTGAMFSIGSVGGDYNNAQANAAWYTVSNPPSSLTSIAATGGGSGTGNFCSVWGIEVNGVRVVDISASGCDSLLDSPTNYEASSGNNGGNYATWNPLISTNNLTNGNLSVVQPVNSTVASRYSTIGMSTGKWYWEISVEKYWNTVFGVRTPSGGSLETPYDSSGYGMGWRSAGGFYLGGGNTGSGSLSLAGGDLLGLAFDADAGTLAFYKNGSLVHTLTAASSYIGETWFAGSQDSAGGNSDHDVNFGQYPFKYPPGGTGGPSSDYKSLCTQNLDDPLIANPSTAFDVKTYNGNGGTQTISGLGFRPDLVWVKRRNAAVDHILFDAVRGFGANKELVSNDTYTEGATGTGNPNTDVWGYVDSVTDDGFVVEKGSNSTGSVANTTGGTYVSWAWDAGNAANPTSISAGSLNSSLYLQGDVYSSDISTNDPSGTTGAANAFDGDVSTRAQTVGAGTNKTLTWAPSPAVSFSNKFEIYCDQGSNVPTATWNGNTISPGGGQWVTVYTGSGTIDSTTPLVINTNTAQQYATLKAVRLDGRILVDSNVTLSSVPSIASSYRANQSAGFSIVSYTGDDASSGTVAHGLNAKPAFMIIKNRDTSGHDWVVYHQALGATKRLDLNSAGGPSTNIAQFNNTEPTSLVFTVGTYDNINTTDQYIAYVFTPVPGFSAFGGPYTGTGTTTGPFQYCGFRPRWIMIKPFVIGSSSNGSNWVIFDTARSTYNETGEWLKANDTGDEYVGTQDQIDILSNGFIPRQGNTQVNHQSNQYIWIAFAENPFKYARAR